jgi:hypothetical protein
VGSRLDELKLVYGSKLENRIVEPDLGLLKHAEGGGYLLPFKAAYWGPQASLMPSQSVVLDSNFEADFDGAEAAQWFGRSDNSGHANLNLILAAAYNVREFSDVYQLVGRKQEGICFRNLPPPHRRQKVASWQRPSRGDVNLCV